MTVGVNIAEDSQRIATPVPVQVKNWPDPPAKQPLVKNTVLRTVFLSTTGGDGTTYQISDYEPKRVRLVVIPLDAAITILDSVPTASPDTSGPTAKPTAGGAVLPTGIQPYEFFGPDALWLNRLGTDTRVTIIKEFC